MGGSQGARSINRAMVAALPKLLVAHPTLRMIHQTGERDYEDVVAAYRTIEAGGDLPRRLPVEVVPFLFDVPRAFRQADLIVSRSGATTVAEITACGKPAILIPFPHAIHGHQERNARILEKAGAATVILDVRLTGETLAATITALLGDPGKLGEMGRCSKGLGRADSAERVVTACRALVGHGGASAGPPPDRVGQGGAQAGGAPSR
jgi:UDP-N-acetylglucosamine--N-acetylmuramyl-(pentapeptide) pyrophosphoryl-undecaprenol N-acetylglucosamine transferase